MTFFLNTTSDAISGLKSVSGVWNKFMPLMRLYQTATLKPLVDLDATWSDITSTQVSADLGLVVSGTKTGQLLMWDINSGALVNTIKAHDNAIMDLQVQNAKLVTASLDGRVRFWDALAYAQFNVDFTSKNDGFFQSKIINQINTFLIIFFIFFGWTTDISH